jgi:hypothetical protein
MYSEARELALDTDAPSSRPCGSGIRRRAALSTANFWARLFRNFWPPRGPDLRRTWINSTLICGWFSRISALTDQSTEFGDGRASASDGYPIAQPRDFRPRPLNDSFHSQLMCGALRRKTDLVAPHYATSDCVRARLTVTSSTLINEPPPGGVKKR